jgi:hypothetical protein
VIPNEVDGLTALRCSLNPQYVTTLPVAINPRPVASLVPLGSSLFDVISSIGNTTAPAATIAIPVHILIRA